MLELDFAVALALVLSVASTVLCAVYGLIRWNADGEPGDDPPEASPMPVETRRARERDGR